MSFGRYSRFQIWLQMYLNNVCILKPYTDGIYVKQNNFSSQMKKAWKAKNTIYFLLSYLSVTPAVKFEFQGSMLTLTSIFFLLLSELCWHCDLLLQLSFRFMENVSWQLIWCLWDYSILCKLYDICAFENHNMHVNVFVYMWSFPTY